MWDDGCAHQEPELGEVAFQSLLFSSAKDLDYANLVGRIAASVIACVTTA